MQMSETVYSISNHRIVRRAMRLASLKVDGLVTIARDPGATVEAATVVAVVALARAVGSGPDSLHELAVSFIVGIIGWLVVATLAFFLSANVFGTPSTHANVDVLIRTLGYAKAPAVLGFVVFFPLLGGIVATIGAIWAFIVAVFAIRYTLGLSTGRALVTALIATGITSIVTALLSLFLGIGFDIAFT